MTNQTAGPPASSRPAPRPIFRGPMGAGVGPPQKAKSFRASARRLLGRLGPERPLFVIVLILAVASVGLVIAGPEILGRATDLVFGPLQAHRAIDFVALGRVLTIALAVYLGSSLFGWLQGHLLNYVVQRTVKRMRTAVEDKLMRVPLSYFDGRPHGDSGPHLYSDGRPDREHQDL